MTTTTRTVSTARRLVGGHAAACCSLFAMLAAVGGCTTWTTRTVPVEPIQWDPPTGAPPELVLDGTWDEWTGELVISLSAMLPAGSPAPRVERCARTGNTGGSIGAGLAGAGLLGLGIGLVVDGTQDRGGGQGGMFSGLSNIGNSLDGLETAGGALALASGIAAAAAAIVLATPDDDEAECSIEDPVFGAPPTTAPLTVPVEHFVVWIYRADGSELVRTVSGPEARIALEPAPFACPGTCLATIARRVRAGRPSESELAHERITIEAIPQGELYGAAEAPTASGVIDVTFMP